MATNPDYMPLEQSLGEAVRMALRELRAEFPQHRLTKAEIHFDGPRPGRYTSVEIQATGKVKVTGHRYVLIDADPLVAPPAPPAEET